MDNQTVLSEFILLGISSDSQLQVGLFLVFLLIYAMTLLGNSAIMLIIRAEASLQTPMFFFLSHLAFLDICYSTVTAPKMLENFIAKRKTISLVGCLAQIFFLLQCGCTEFFLLSAMAYDRYIAICEPLHYTAIMRKEICRQLVGGAWGMGFLCALLNTMPLHNLSFCRQNTISHYSCELPSVLSLSCSETFTNYMFLLASVFIFGLSSFVPILVSYTYIISSILKIHSPSGRSKAFSTCSSHLIVVSSFYLSAAFRYMKPSSKSLTVLDSVVSIQYSILTPMINPIIYSLKNNEIKGIIWKRFVKYK